MNRRTIVVVVVSPKRYANRIDQVQIVIRPVITVSTIRVPNAKPRKRLPESPMKTLAGGQLKPRNAKVDTARRPKTSASPGSDASLSELATRIDRTDAALMKTAPVAASPSMPSTKLTTFI